MGSGEEVNVLPAPAAGTLELKGSEVVLVMSNGGFGGIPGKLLNALAGRWRRANGGVPNPCRSPALRPDATITP